MMVLLQQMSLYERMELLSPYHLPLHEKMKKHTILCVNLLCLDLLPPLPQKIQFSKSRNEEGEDAM